MKKRRIRMASTIAMILTMIIVMPIAANATPLDPFGNQSVLLDVSITQDGNGWKYSYDVKNPGAILYSMSVGFLDPISSNVYEVGTFVALSPAAYTRTTDSLMLTFNPSLTPSGLPVAVGYDFSITYAGFIDDQYITFRTVGSGGSKTKMITAKYEPVPEPGTLLLLGVGALTVGLIYRRRRKAC